MSKRKPRERTHPLPRLCPDGIVRLTWAKDVTLPDGTVVTMMIAKEDG